MIAARETLKYDHQDDVARQIRYLRCETWPIKSTDTRLPNDSSNCFSTASLVLKYIMSSTYIPMVDLLQ
jgi:hypothetical protein